jgi:hypothetical protein
LCFGAIDRPHTSVLNQLVTVPIGTGTHADLQPLVQARCMLRFDGAALKRPDLAQSSRQSRKCLRR